VVTTTASSYACASGNSGKASKCNGTGTTTGIKMINYLASKMIYIFSSPTSFKAYYCNPGTASNLVCTSNLKMTFTSDVNGFIQNALPSSTSIKARF